MENVQEERIKKILELFIIQKIVHGKAEIIDCILREYLIRNVQDLIQSNLKIDVISFILNTFITNQTIKINNNFKKSFVKNIFMSILDIKFRTYLYEKAKHMPITGNFEHVFNIKNKYFAVIEDIKNFLLKPENRNELTEILKKEINTKEN